MTTIILPSRHARPAGRQGISFSPALTAGPDQPDHATSKHNTAAAAGSAAGNGETGETLHTTIASGNAEGAETKSSLSMSIMELFDTRNGGGGGADGAGVAPVAVTPSARVGSGTAASAAATAAGIQSPLPPPASAAPAPHAWNVNSLTNHSKTAPPSTSTGGSGGGRTSLGSVGGAERHGYLSFSEVQVSGERAKSGERGRVGFSVGLLLAVLFRCCSRLAASCVCCTNGGETLSVVYVGS